jgi:hypothetical protein
MEKNHVIQGTSYNVANYMELLISVESRVAGRPADFLVASNKEPPRKLCGVINLVASQTPDFLVAGCEFVWKII